MQSFFEGFLDRLSVCRKGMSVSAFARHLGLNQKTLDLYIKGDRKPSVELVIAVCSRCGVSADWLLGIDDSSATPRVTAANGSAAAANGSTASVTTGSSAETARLLGIIESQQRVIETLTAGPRP